MTEPLLGMEDAIVYTETGKYYCKSIVCYPSWVSLRTDADESLIFPASRVTHIREVSEALTVRRMAKDV